MYRFFFFFCDSHILPAQVAFLNERKISPETRHRYPLSSSQKITLYVVKSFDFGRIEPVGELVPNGTESQSLIFVR